MLIDTAHIDNRGGMVRRDLLNQHERLIKVGTVPTDSVRCFLCITFSQCFCTSIGTTLGAAHLQMVSLSHLREMRDPTSNTTLT